MELPTTKTKSMTERIENFLKNLSIEELNAVRNTASNLIHGYKDGFQYECKVRSYGRNWTDKMYNAYSVQELCYEYSGENGIIDVYTTNPKLDIDNYGENYYFPSMEDAERWRNYNYLENNIPKWKKDIEEWNNRERLPFNYRPSFAPHIDEEEIADSEKELATLKETIIMPVRLGYNHQQNVKE